MYSSTHSKKARTRVARKLPVSHTQDEDIQPENGSSEQHPAQIEKSASAKSARQQKEQNVTSTRQEMVPLDANGTQSSKQQKRKRGPTKMEILRKCPNQKMQIDFNASGQPHGANSVKFVSFLGVIARQEIPIVIEWKQLEEEKWKPLKDEVWSLVQQSFIVNDSHKGVIFKMMGKYWRQYKSKITREIIKANELPNTPIKRHAFQLIKPPSVKSEKDWNTFVKARLATSFQVTSQRFSTLRKSQKYTHTMSRKGYARLENELLRLQKSNYPNPDDITRVELWTIGHQKKDGAPINEAAAEIMEQMKSCNESTENPPSKDCIQDDALARVLGPESRGRVRGLGFGAIHSKVDIVKSNARLKQLEAYVKTQEDRIGTIEAQFQALLEKNQKNPDKNVEDISAHVESPQWEQESYNTHDQSTDLQHARCRLLNWYNFDAEEVVAEGHIASFDPRSLVHNVPVGRDCWKVWVDQVLDQNLALYRPTDEFRKLGEALESTVAWPKSSIKML